MAILDQFGNPMPPQQTANAPYRGGGQNRLWKEWQPPHRSGDSAIGENWNLLTARIRDLFRNEPVMKSAKRALSKHVIGTGIQTFAEAMLDPDETDDDFNFESDDEFDQWSEEEADVEGRLAWPQMQWLHFNETMESGESLMLKCASDRPGRSMPLCYQLLEPEQIDDTMDWPAGEGRNKCVRGIEFDRFNRPAAYWLYDAHPYDEWSSLSTKSTRIPADRVIHSYLPGRASEHRGVTWFSANVQSAKDLDWYLGNEMTAAALGALLSIIIKRANGSGSGALFGPAGGETDEYGNQFTRLGRGTVADIGPDDDVSVAESKRPNRDAEPFIKLILQLQAMGIGCSYLRLTGDYSQASYTSARGAHLDDQAFFVVLQAWAGRSFVTPVRKEHTRQAAAHGLFRSIGARQFLARQRQMLRLTIQPPGREQLDPDKETNAALGRIRGGLSTLQDECGLRGKNWRRIIRQRAREEAYCRRLGVTPDLSYSPTYIPEGEEETPPAAKPRRQPAFAGEDD